MEDNTDVFVGIDVAKLRNAVTVADGGRNGELRYLGEFDADEASMRRVVKRLADKHERIMFCYEAGPTGYGLLPADQVDGPRVHGRGTIAHPAPAGRSGEDEPARCARIGQAVAGRRAHIGLGAG